VREVALGAFAHQDVPFEKLVEELQPQRDLSRNPLCQVVFQHLNVPPVGEQSSDDESPALEIERGATTFDLTLTLWESGGGLRGFIEYNTDLFDAGTIARMAQHYENLLLGIAADPDQRIAELPLLAPQEHERLLKDWNATAQRYPELDLSLTELLARQVARRPEVPAFLCEEQTLSYAALEQRSNRLARYLMRQGVGPGVVVGVCLERSLELAVALWAIWKAGGVYLPLDPAYPAERLAWFCRDAQAALILSDRRWAGKLAGQPAPCVWLEDERERISRDSAAAPARVAANGQLAYLIYTSGSTGPPKGVAVEHRQLLNRLAWMWKLYPFAAGEICCQRTSLNFVDSLWEWLGGLLAGVPALIVSDSTVRDPVALVEALAQHRVTRLWVVPSLLAALLDSEPELGRKLPALRFWVSSGEVLSAALWERFQKAMPEARLYNLYGTSEIWDATWHAGNGPEPGRATVPIGRPIGNVEVYVLDSRLRPVPGGVPGELYVGGMGLARGYVREPSLTAGCFVPDPYSGRAGARLYRTGDRVRYREDGEVEYLGRQDRQVKIRGYRIELSEIESVLSEHRGVRRAAVVALPDGRGELRLVGYVESHGDSAGMATEAEARTTLRRYLEERLPEYMIPAPILLLDALPLTPSGKIDRLALPHPDTARSEPAAALALETGTEERLAKIWAEILATDSIGNSDNFFELGGHSLLATRLISRARDIFHVELPLRAVFEEPTLGRFAALVDRAMADDRHAAAPAITPLSRDRYRVALSDTDGDEREQYRKATRRQSKPAKK
jgi:amino acid adenylation domain-containing protein